MMSFVLGLIGIAISLTVNQRNQHLRSSVPSNTLFLNGEPLTLNGGYLTLN